MTRLAGVALLLLGLLGCDNSFTIGPTTFQVMDGSELTIWPDLPEGMDVMQQLSNAPEGTWDVDVLLYPEWHPVGHAGSACNYDYELDRIRVRVGGRTTADGCLPHEFAHRWRHLEAGRSALNHDKAFWARTATLTRAARQTWAH